MYTYICIYLHIYIIYTYILYICLCLSLILSHLFLKLRWVEVRSLCKEIQKEENINLLIFKIILFINSIKKQKLKKLRDKAKKTFISLTSYIILILK